MRLAFLWLGSNQRPVGYRADCSAAELQRNIKRGAKLLSPSWDRTSVQSVKEPTALPAELPRNESYFVVIASRVKLHREFVGADPTSTLCRCKRQACARSAQGTGSRPIRREPVQASDENPRSLCVHAR